MQSYALAFATWSDVVGAGLARRQALARALARWENRGLTRAFNLLEERARAARTLLHAWIAGCAEEIAQRHALLNRWSHSTVLPTPTSHPPSYVPGEPRTPWATSLQRVQLVDTEAAAADAAAERAEEEISSEVHSLKEWVQTHRWDRTGHVRGAHFASSYCTPASPALTPFS